MAQWFRGIFKTRSAPVVTEARAALVPPPPPPDPPPPTLWERVVFWRAELRRETEAQPSVDEAQRRDAEEMEHRARGHGSHRPGHRPVGRLVPA